MCRIGNGYNGMKRFLVLMNHLPPMTEKNYRKLSNVFRNLVKHVAETVMKDESLESTVFKISMGWQSAQT